ncbi:MAG: ABC transporter permease [Spirochaetia bacterium]
MKNNTALKKDTESAGRLLYSKRKTRLVQNIIDYKTLYLMMLPGLLIFFLYKYGPMYGLIIAFKDYNMKEGIWGSPWVGLKHFQDMFRADSFYTVFRNTILIQFYKLAINFPGPIILALMLNEIRNIKFKRSIQTVVYLPHFLSWVIVGGLVVTLLKPTGTVNQIFASLGLPTYNWMMEPKFFRGIVVVSALWKNVGWGTIVYLAALSVINIELYEAAYVDGARRWQQLWNITLPSLVPTIIILFILQLGRILEVGFEQIFVLYNPITYEVGDVFSTYIYRVGLRGMRFSYTTAMGIFESGAGVILVLIANKFAKKISEGEYGIW